MSVPATMRAWESGASGNELLVLLALADHAGGDDDPYGAAYPSVERLEKMTRLSRRTVQRALRMLEEAGWIRKTGEHKWPGGRGKMTNEYRIETGRQVDAGRQDGGGVAGDTEGASPVAPKPSEEPSDGSSSSTAHEMDADVAALLKRKVKVGGQIVTPEEMERAAAALAEFNRQAGAEFGLGAHLTPLVMRIRERPAYDVEAHVRLVQSAWRVKWWERNGRGGRVTPKVIYGNAGCFENVVQDAVDEKAGRAPVEGPERERRFTREDD